LPKQKLEPDARTLGALRGLGKLACTKEEAAAYLGVSRPTLWKFLENNEEAKTAWEDGFEEAKTSLRRIQWKLAKSSAAMAIFLGKQLLGQKDNYGLEHGGKMELSANATRENIERKLARVSNAESKDEMAS
jgi:hypothetical protein